MSTMHGGQFWRLGIYLRCLGIITLTAGSVVMLPVCHAAIYSFTNLDHLAEIGAPPPYYGINDTGQVVGYEGTHGLLYSEGNYTYLDFPFDPSGYGSPVAFTRAYGINNSGQIVGYLYSNPNNAYHSFIYSQGTYNALPDVPGAEGFTFATDINDNGHIVGYFTEKYSYAYTYRGFLYTGGEYTRIDVPNSASTSVYGINNNGLVVGSYQVKPGDHNHGFLYNGLTYTTLDCPNSYNTEAYGINDSGQVVGRCDLNPYGEISFVYDGSTYTLLRYANSASPNPANIEARGINNKGQLTGNYGSSDSNGSYVEHGFIATPNIPSSPGSGIIQTVLASSNSVQVGQQFVYTVNITNYASVSALKAKLSDKLPRKTKLISVSTTAGNCKGKTVLVCNFGTIEVGGSVSANISVVGTKVGTLKNKAMIRYLMPKKAGTAKLRTYTKTATVQTTVTP